MLIGQNQKSKFSTMDQFTKHLNLTKLMKVLKQRTRLITTHSDVTELIQSNIQLLTQLETRQQRVLLLKLATQKNLHLNLILQLISQTEKQAQHLLLTQQKSQSRIMLTQELTFLTTLKLLSKTQQQAKKFQTNSQIQQELKVMNTIYQKLEPIKSHSLSLMTLAMSQHL